MKDQGRMETDWLLVILSIFIGFFIYPQTLVPTGPSYAHGGVIGLICLVVSATLCWSAFFLARSHPFRRWCLYLPLAGLFTQMAMFVVGLLIARGRWLNF